MKLHCDNGTFYAESSFDEKDAVKAAGFKWHPAFEIDGKRRWYTRDPKAAARLIAYADGGVHDYLTAEVKTAQKSLDESHAIDADFEPPCPEGLAFLPYQKGGVRYGLTHPNVLIGDEMGLGKTIQALGIINSDPSIRRVLVICPASLKLNWKREADKWLTRTDDRADWFTKIAGADFPFVSPQACSVVMINYDILKKHADAIRATTWDILIVDEAHYLKNPKALRTKNVLGHEATTKEINAWGLKKASAKRDGKKAPAEPKTIAAITARRRVFLTGTPIPNRPIEVQPLAGSLDPAQFGDFFAFARRYANAERGAFGWDFSGASNLGELQERMRSSFMVRRLKVDVLTELPPKRRQIIEIDLNGAADIVKRENVAWDKVRAGLDDLRAAVEVAKASDDDDEYTSAVKALRAGEMAAFSEMSKLRHATAVAKVPHVIEHIRSFVDDDPDYSVIVFAHHKDVVKKIVDAFEGKAVSITGDTPMQKRQDAVDAFQAGRVQIFVGNIQAAGVGITLTRSAHVIFAELDWVPGNVTQAEDRAHRIGQLNSVLVQHLVLDGSLDSVMAKTIVRKQAIIEKALDGKREVGNDEIVVPAPSATAKITRKALQAAQPKVGDEQRAAILVCLQALSTVCDGAVQQDGTGFNGIDSRIGKSLADNSGLSGKQAFLGQSVIRKYRSQLERYGVGSDYSIAIQKIEKIA